MNSEQSIFRSGFVAIIGLPNVGKSTLLNRLLEQKIAITSPRPQTTRNRILGIKNLDNAQLIFIDTPGIHSSAEDFNRRIVQTALAAINEVNAVLWLVDGSQPATSDRKLILDTLDSSNRPVILAFNKIDLIEKSKLLPLIDEYRSIHQFEAVIPISALYGDGLDILLNELVALLPEGPQYYPSDMITDLPERFLVSELVREKVMRLCYEEVPYGVAVTVDSFQEKPEKNVVVVHATIQVERQSQKGILIGKGGSMLKRIGEQARKDIEGLLGTKVFLQLFVRVARNWRKDEELLRRFGY